MVLRRNILQRPLQLGSRAGPLLIGTLRTGPGFTQFEGGLLILTLELSQGRSRRTETRLRLGSRLDAPLQINALLMPECLC